MSKFYDLSRGVMTLNLAAVSFTETNGGIEICLAPTGVCVVVGGEYVFMYQWCCLLGFNVCLCSTLWTHVQLLLVYSFIIEWSGFSFRFVW